MNETQTMPLQAPSRASAVRPSWRNALAWCRSSGLSDPALKIATDSLRTMLPGAVICCGLVASAGALIHILFLEPGFRPYLLIGHAVFTAVGIYWYWHPPQRINLASAAAAAYLTFVFGLYMVTGHLNSALHLGILIVGGTYVSLDRRLLIVHAAMWLLCIIVVGAVWLPRGEGLSVLVISLIAAAGGGIMRQFRRISIENLVRLQDQLDQAIAEREQALERAQNAEKLESLGVMAAGVAHDYNNLLVGVVGGADLAMIARTEEDKREALETIRVSADALCGLSAQLLEVAGGRPITKTRIDLNKLIRETIRATSQSEGDMARITLQLDDATPWVQGENESIRQIILNLLSNARRFASQAVGAISVGTQLDADANAVLLWVEDDGPGVPQELENRVFDPFFSTTDEHRGLGLATVRTIVARHEGQVAIGSAEGGRFEVYLPTTRGAVAADPDQTPYDHAVLNEGCLVVLIEDERQVREVTARMLRLSGFDVVAAASGQEAIANLKDGGHQPDVAVVDALMPVTDGIETIAMLRGHFGTIPALLISGYLAAGNGRELPKDVRFLTKPFDLEKLNTALAEFTSVAPFRTAKRG